MLILSRKYNEWLMVGDDVKITVIELCRDKVRLGIEAPKDVAVHRGEIWLKVQEEKKGSDHAANSPPER